MSALESQWIPVFRAGDYGAKGSYSTADLDQIVADAKPDEIPNVIGHPKIDSPAVAWVKQFRRNGDELEMQPSQVDPEFENAVKVGRYKKRSIAIARGKDGKLRIRHIGWLGGALPEVQGLRDAKFSDEEFEAIDFAAEEPSMAEEQKFTFSEWWGKLWGDKAPAQPAATPDVQVAVDKAVTAVKAEFAQQIEAEKTERKRIETEFSSFRNSVTATGATERVRGLIAGLKASKRWLPAYDKMGVPELFAALASGSTTEITFSEGDKQKKLDGVQLFHDVLNGIGQVVPEGTLVNFAANGEKHIDVKPGVDPESVLFHQAVEKRAADKKISYNDAYKQLKQEGFKPQAPGTSTAAAV